MLASSYPFLSVMWTMLVFFAWVIWFWLLFTIWGDVFRRHDISGWGKAAWLIFTVVLPFVGVLVYLVTQSDGMTERNVRQARSQREQFDSYVRDVAGDGSPAAEIDRAKQLLDNGAITQTEFDTIKAKALAA